MAHNDEMNLAWQYVEGTDVSVFLTGKAGTGKTTFLRKVKELAPKRMVVVAPTGVAAINAQGVTIHSFFQLSPGVHVPGMKEAEPKGKERFYQMGKDKKNIMRTMDLLVIDEISMVRCDLLDAIDDVLRKYKDRNKPFGGVQLLLIGDLQQLAPVATDQEWQLLQPYYDTPYFFSSRALRQINYVTIELKHIYRQSDNYFVNLLGKIREGRVDDEVMRVLGARYIPNFRAPLGEAWIRLTTHNYMAQRHNEMQLSMLNGDLQNYTATMEGNFPESSFPADRLLQLKVGAQVMFLKNDASGEHLYYNGKIGTVVALTRSSVMVQCAGESKAISVEPAEWENKKYTIDQKSGEIKEEIDGKFTQYPLRLAWAITVHKSQGLTFDHAVVDINDAFAHGQVYVALSRCRSLEGLVLARPLELHSLQQDEQVESFIEQQQGREEMAKSQLGAMRSDYFRQLLDELFSMTQCMYDLNYLVRVVDEHLYHQQPEYLTLLKETQKAVAEAVLPVLDKFHAQYNGLLESGNQEFLQERVRKASAYFVDQLLKHFVPVINNGKLIINNQAIKKQFTNAMDSFTTSYKVKYATFRYCADEGFSVRGYLKSKAAALVGKTSAKSLKLPKTPTAGGTERKTRRHATGVSEAEEGSLLAQRLGVVGAEEDAPPKNAERPAWKWYWKGK